MRNWGEWGNVSVYRHSLSSAQSQLLTQQVGVKNVIFQYTYFATNSIGTLNNV